MPTTQRVEDIVGKVQKRLEDATSQGVHLKVSDNKLDDGWLYIVVTPTRPGVRASDHARLMAQIERELRQDGEDRVLLVPTLDD